MKELNKNSNSVYKLNYHLIIVVKYRQTIFDDDNIVEALKQFIEKVGEPYGVEVMSQECGIDHIHLLISTKPTTDLTKYINILKGHSSRFLRKEFGEQLKEKLWGEHLWSPSYFISSVGNVSIDTLHEYIANQRTLM